FNGSTVICQCIGAATQCSYMKGHQFACRSRYRTVFDQFQSRYSWRVGQTIAIWGEGEEYFFLFL
ncbi:MAG: hypothetical protein VKM97_07920, partial [Cyanobacteriota bacterium]|nr:hypothetical protein [Cyanobacteriota bacterium]